MLAEYGNIIIATGGVIISNFVTFKLMEHRIASLEARMDKAVTKQECDHFHTRNSERIDDVREAFEKMQAKLDEMQVLLHKMAAKMKVE